LKSEEKSQQRRTASHNNKQQRERQRERWKKETEWWGYWRTKRLKRLFHQEAWLCLLVCANPFLRGVDDDEYNTSFSSSFVFVQNTV
jgi:hypothetical protein